MKYPQNESEWIHYAHEQAIWLVENVSWPWTERQKRQWFIGVLAGVFTREFLEAATMEQLQEAHRELSK